MTIAANNSPWVRYVGNGSLTQFAVPWPFFLNSDIEAYVDGALTTAYVLTGAGVASTGGTLTFYAAPANNADVFLRRVTQRSQLLDYQPNDAFNSESHEAALNRLTLQVQDLLEELSRRPALAVTIANALRSLQFPSPVASGLIGWNSDKTALTTFPASILTVTPDAVSGLVYGKTSAVVNSIAGAAALTAAALIPAGAKVLGVTYRCLIAFSAENGLTSVDLGGMGLTSGWGSLLGITAGTVSGAGNQRGDEPNAVSAENVTLLANGGLFGATGQAKITVHWRTLTPDT